MIKSIPQRWRVLSGLNNWQNLLSPLDRDLQRYLLHYGSMAQAAYDAFNSERVSKNAGSSRYARRNLFSSVGLVKGNFFEYEAVKYIYAASTVPVPESYIMKSVSGEGRCGVSNWMAFVAVASDKGKIALGRRDILVAWRGTIQPIEWVKDFEFPLVSASPIVGKGGGCAEVHQGLLSLYTSSDPKSRFNRTSAKDQVLSELKKLLKQYKDEEVSITVTGHSLGAALSVLTAADIVCNGHNKIDSEPNRTCPVTAFLFGSFQTGNSYFRDILESNNDLHILNICNVLDVVPMLPPLGYSEVGVKLSVDTSESPYLKQPGDLVIWHSLESAYLHALALEEGSEGKRDFALVNKTADSLKDEYLIPAKWWVEKNRGMVQLDNGRWKLHDHENEEDEHQVSD